MDLLALLKTKLLMASNQRLTREQFERRRLRRFRAFAAFVMRRSPYYARIMRENQINPANCAPQQFPILTKTEVIEHFDEMVTAPDVNRAGIEEFLHRSHDSVERYRGLYTVIHTSGSSGQVGYFVYDGNAWARGMAQASVTPDLGFIPRRRRVAFLGATDGHYAGVSMIGAIRFAPFNLLYTGKFFEINAPLRDTIDGLNALQPDILLGYGSALGVLAENQLEGPLKIYPRMITNSGEPLQPSSRDVIEQAFGRCVRNVYSCSEHLFMGVREAGSDSMRLIEDELIFEIHLDHTLVTNMFNRVLPLIRYRMNDVIVPIDSDVHKPYRAVAEVVGRVEQIAKFRNRHGVLDGISPHTINELLIPNVRRFQMRINGEASFNLAIVLNSDATEQVRSDAIFEATSRLRAILAQKEMENVVFTITPVADIPVDSQTGKFKLILEHA
jgi:phenylacetate-CoA ligase